MNRRQMEVYVEEVKPDSYFLVNTKQTGYYRVHYDDANWMLIANELSYGNFSLIPPNSRAMLIDDAAVFFENKILKVRILLELIKYLQNDVRKLKRQRRQTLKFPFRLITFHGYLLRIIWLTCGECWTTETANCRWISK